MLFFKKKKKLDSKVRFSHKKFTTKLDTARNFKRTAKAVPETKFEQILVKLGLSSRWSQILLVLLVLALLYLIYIPNFLSVREIRISGLSEQQTSQLDAAIRQRIGDSPFYNPQYNLVFLSNDLIYKAAEDVPSIDFVSSIQKDIKTQTLIVDSASKYERFLLTTPEQDYDLYNDGTIKAVSGVGLDDWRSNQNPNMVKVLL